MSKSRTDLTRTSVDKIWEKNQEVRCRVPNPLAKIKAFSGDVFEKGFFSNESETAELLKTLLQPVVKITNYKDATGYMWNEESALWKEAKHGEIKDSLPAFIRYWRGNNPDFEFEEEELKEVKKVFRGSSQRTL